MDEKFLPGKKLESLDDVPATAPVPLPELTGDGDPNRLWIGNIDPRLSEYSLMKILQKCGELVKYDYMYHKFGPEKGQPKGFCFATYQTKEQAMKAQRSLSGKTLLSKRIFVKWAHEEKEPEKKSVSIVGTGTELGATSKSDIQDPESAIRAIEAKLRAMEENSDVTPPVPMVRLGPDRPKTSVRDSKHQQSKPYHRDRR